jgi:hypothetical protein
LVGLTFGPAVATTTPPNHLDEKGGNATCCVTKLLIAPNMNFRRGALFLLFLATVAHVKETRPLETEQTHANSFRQDFQLG